MKPTCESIWSYIGPEANGCPSGQLHMVRYSTEKEVITIGLPYGHGGTWLGTAKDFAEQFKFRQTHL